MKTGEEKKNAFGVIYLKGTHLEASIRHAGTTWATWTLQIQMNENREEGNAMKVRSSSLLPWGRRFKKQKKNNLKNVPPTPPLG